MAGLLYLPRLFVYHTQVAAVSVASRVFVTMERRLYRFIMVPAMVSSWASGIFLVLFWGFEDGVWLHAKVLMAIAMTMAHFAMGTWRRRFAGDNNRHSERFYRAFNEVPTLLMIVMVIMVIIKPF